MGTPRGRFRILFVCTGNICRSPIAERLTRHGLARRLGAAAASFHVESAGTWGHDGSPMEPFALQVLREYGVAADDFVGRELTAEHILVADLVLTATRDHEDQVLSIDRYAGRRTFPLTEFARLVRSVDQGALPAGDPAARAGALVDAADALRRRLPAAGPYDDDIPDPLGSPLHVYRLCGECIADVVESLLDAMAVADVRRAV
jgi:protein-tyrosine phosphatase